MTVNDESALAVRQTVAGLVAVYQAETARIRAACQVIAEAEDALTKSFSLGEWNTVRLDTRHHLDFHKPEDALVKLRHECWSAIIDRLEIRRGLSVARCNELHQQLERHQLPELTVESAFQLIDSFRTQYRDLLAEAVCEVFEWLRPPGSRYARNSELEVPRRVAIAYAVEFWSNGFMVRSHSQSRLVAMENVFSSLDGRSSVSGGRLCEAIRACKTPGALFETEYFRARCYRNSSLHLEFRRIDLLARFNAIAGGRRLRPASEARP